MQVRTRKTALVEGITAGILFGTASIFIRTLQSLDAFSIAFWRLIIACLVLVAILAIFRKGLRFSFIRRNLKDLAILSFFLGLHFIFFISAVKDTSILNATVLVNTTPIFSIFISSFAFRLKPSRLAIIGLVVSFIGICVIGYAENSSSSNAVFSPNLKGDLEAVAAAFVESIYLSYGKRIRSQANALSIMLPIYFMTAIVVGGLAVPAANGLLALPATPLNLLALLGLGMLPTATAHTLYFSSLSNLKSFETATMALIEPVGATVLGVVFFQEIPELMFAFGAALILAGVLFVVEDKS